MVILRYPLGDPRPVRNFKQGVQPIRARLVRAKYPEVSLFHVQFHHVTEKRTHHLRRLGGHRPGRGYRYSILPEVRHLEVSQQESSVRMRVCPHPPAAFWSEFRKLINQRSVFIKEPLG